LSPARCREFCDRQHRCSCHRTARRGCWCGGPMQRILVTGDRGLIGTVLTRRLQEAGHEVIGCDVAGDEIRDVIDAKSVDALVATCTGVVHLAAVSRVILGEREPARCHLVNVQGTRNVLSAAARIGARHPWILYGSSREVYGQAERLPVRESAPLRPMNVYARSKADAEKLVIASREEAGLKTSIIRFSNVYGSVSDHSDRVVPAFARLASQDRVLIVAGNRTILDFTHVEDVAEGLLKIIEVLSSGETLPTLHFVSGQGTMLTELAAMAIELAGKGRVEIAEPRSYDVESFVGDPIQVDHILGWRTTIPLRAGVGRLIDLFRQGR
jgi:nucleoside-diphosphate-sugar epimerase